MVKCKKICSADHIVLDASARAYTNLGSSDSPTLQYLLENPDTGFLTYYYRTGCKSCSNECNAEIYANAIDALAKINYFFIPSYLQLQPTDEVADLPPAYIAYLTLLYLLQLYVDKSTGCCEKEYKNYNKIFCQAFKTIENSGVSIVVSSGTMDTIFETPVINLNVITATARYVSLNLGCQGIGITNTQVGGGNTISGVPT